MPARLSCGVRGPGGFTTCGKEFPVLTTVQGMPAAANLEQAILFAQLQILRRLDAQRSPR
jgi:hypothetical protein